MDRLTERHYRRAIGIAWVGGFLPGLLIGAAVTAALIAWL